MYLRTQNSAFKYLSRKTWKLKMQKGSEYNPNLIPLTSSFGRIERKQRDTVAKKPNLHTIAFCEMEICIPSIKHFQRKKNLSVSLQFSTVQSRSRKWRTLERWLWRVFAVWLLPPPPSTQEYVIRIRARTGQNASKPRRMMAAILFANVNPAFLVSFFFIYIFSIQINCFSGEFCEINDCVTDSPVSTSQIVLRVALLGFTGLLGGFALFMFIYRCHVVSQERVSLSLPLWI